MRTIAVKVLVAVLATIVSLTSHAEGETGKVYRVGVLLYGGPYHEAIKGLRDGLRESGFEEGKHYVLDIHDGRSWSKKRWTSYTLSRGRWPRLRSKRLKTPIFPSYSLPEAILSHISASFRVSRDPEET